MADQEIRDKRNTLAISNLNSVNSTCARICGRREAFRVGGLLLLGGALPILGGCGDSAPQSQKKFEDMLEAQASAYEKANPIQKPLVRAERARRIMELLPTRSFEGWAGKIAKFSTTLGSVSVDIASSHSSIVSYGQGFLGDSSRPNGLLYESMKNLHEGDRVTFSGSMPSDPRDYVLETSLTESGGMARPAFYVNFTSLKKR